MKTIQCSSWARLARAFLGVAAMAAATCLSSTAFAAAPGAIYTSDSTGTIINENHYDLRTSVYLVGGPDSGQVPPGDYCIRVVAPDGTLLGESNGPVTFMDDSILQIWAYVFKAFDDPDAGELAGTQGYNLTTNNGGEYKVILSLTCDFEGGTNKSDNFKVLEAGGCPDCPGDEDVVIGGRKYCDLNGNGEVDAGEGGLAGWTINISWTGSASDGGGLITAVTDADGNWTALIPFGATGLTVSEEVQTGFVQTFPAAPGTWTAAGPIESDEGLTTLDFLNVRTSSVCATKFCDANGNGTRDDGEAVVAGWKMTLVGGSEPIVKYTGADGKVCFDGLLPGTYSVAEEIVEGWLPTTLTEQPADIDLESCDASADVELSFGNVRSSTICATKFYDADGDGNQSGILEVGIPGWKFTLVGTDSLGQPVSLTGCTDAEGKICFGNLLPGDYTIAEGLSITGNWSATTPTEQVVDIATVACNAAPADISKSFGNVCRLETDARTLGFWSNKNGQRLTTASDLAHLSSLHLVDQQGNAFDPGTTGELNDWLLDGNAVNMAYMLSVQLAAMELNVLHSSLTMVNSSTLVYNSCIGYWFPGSNGFITLGDLMDAANASLLANPITVASGEARAYQECLKTTLDRANNNLNFVQDRPCEFEFATPCPVAN